MMRGKTFQCTQSSSTCFAIISLNLVNLKWIFLFLPDIDGDVLQGISQSCLVGLVDDIIELIDCKFESLEAEVQNVSEALNTASYILEVAMLTFISHAPEPTGRATPTCVMYNIIIVLVCIIYLPIYSG